MSRRPYPYRPDIGEYFTGFLRSGRARTARLAERACQRKAPVTGR
jgi:hypothetical protein